MNELTIKVYDADGREIAARNVIDGLCANRFHGIMEQKTVSGCYRCSRSMMNTVF